MVVKATVKNFKEEVMASVESGNVETKEAVRWLKANGELVWSNIFCQFKDEYTAKTVNSFDMVDFIVEYVKTI